MLSKTTAALVAVVMALVPSQAPLGPAALVGIWRAEFSITTPRQGRSAPTTRNVVGEIVLTRMPWVRQQFSISDTLALEGIYDVDFAPFRFDSRRRGQIPQATGRIEGTQVEIRLNPRVSNGSVVMLGVLRGGMVVGHWYYDSPDGPQGMFRLAKQP